FFNISPSEAEIIDPKTRLFLEIVWWLLEGAGYTRARLKDKYQSRIGVWAGAMYQQYQAFDTDPARKAMISLSSFSAMANRVSYFFDFKGPSIAVDTMCSSSLISIHMACESLRKKECKMAVAGGVNLTIHPIKYQGLSMGQLIAGDAGSRSFGDGDGYIPSEGVGAVLLKPLSEAISAKDSILAVIKSTATNHGGHTHGVYVPNPNAQADLIEENFNRSGIDPRSVSYVESAATGSALGDPIEVRALTKAFGKFTSDTNFCSIGSVKSNIGHGEAVSGMAQLTKVVLQLKNKMLVPSIMADPMNPNLSFDNTPFYLQTKPAEWEKPVLTIDGQKKVWPRRATVSSFGAGGSNAHMIIEEFNPPVEAALTDDENTRPQVIVFSARNQDRLQELVRQMALFLETHKKISLVDLAHTLQMGREAMEFRIALVVQDLNTLISSLRTYLTALEKGGSPELEIPFFTGDIETSDSKISDLVSGKTGKAMLDKLLADKELEKLAFYWVNGAKISWETLHEGTRPMMALPLYPFAREKYWLPLTDVVNSSIPDQDSLDQEEDLFQTDPDLCFLDNLKKYLIFVLSQNLKIPKEKINPDRDLNDYGFDSIVALKIMYGIKELFGMEVSGRQILAHSSINDLAGHLNDKAPQELFNTGQNTDQNIAPRNLAKEKIWASSEMPGKNLPFPLSEGQKGLWLLQQLSPESGAYNVPMAFHIKEPFKKAAFLKACRFVQDYYPQLRAVIRETDGIPYQVERDQVPIAFHEERIDGLSKDGMVALLREKAKKPFDLSRGPLMRVGIYSGSGHWDIVFITVHHIVFDGASAGMFIKKIWQAYQDYLEEKEPENRPSKTGYYAFVKWEQELLDSPGGEKHLQYWKKQLSGDIPLLSLPLDRPRSTVPGFAGQTLEKIIGPKLTGKIKLFSKSAKVSLPVLFLGVFNVLLYRISGQTDLCVGMPTLGRPEKRFEDVLGYFINMIVIRTRIKADQGFLELLRELQLTVLDGLDHATYPFPALVKKLNLNRESVASVLYQVSFAYQNFMGSVPGVQKDISQNKDLKNGDIQLIDGIHQEGEDDLGLEIYENKDGFLLKMDYRSNLFDEDSIKRMMKHYLQLFKEILEDSDRPVAHFPMLTKKERSLILEEWNQPVTDRYGYKPVHELISDRAALIPDKTALISSVNPDQTIGYQELNEKANQLAHQLKHQGVGPGTLTGLCLERSFDMIAGILAIFKAGGVYLPLDPDYPGDRLRYMMKDAKVKVVLIHSSTRQIIQSTLEKDVQVIDLDKDREIISRMSTRNPEITLSSENTAYVIYTSGSTGKPKGVQIPHGGIAHHSRVMGDYYNLCQEDRVLLFASPGVDTALEQILPSLAKGAAVVVKDKGIWSPEVFLDRVNTCRITVADLPTAYLHEMLIQWVKQPGLSPGEPLRLVIVGGEALSAETVRLWRRSPMAKTRFINAYGPTETTITSTVFEIEPEFQEPAFKRIPIGRPLGGTFAVILDQNRCLVPEGVSGELCIGGIGVAQGYLNLPDLTRQRFISDPFAIEGASDGLANRLTGGLTGDGRLYRTGDIARFVPGTNGCIEYIGRMDHQVKIRGYRVELGEIEARILQHGDVRECAVIFRENHRGDNQITAYVVPMDIELSSPIFKASLAGFLKKDLQKDLPDYMLPAAYVILDELPLTPGGKVDRMNLPDPGKTGLNTPDMDAGPRNLSEEKLSRIWKGVLEQPDVGIFDNFFDLGGHSLLAVRLISEINKTFNMELPVSSLIRNPCIADMAKQLDRQGQTGEPASPLVCIQPHGKEIPLFCVHPVGGKVLPYMALARYFKDERPFYGLQSPGVEGGKIPGSIEEMARAYISLIQEIQPQGPYCIGGWSFGGIVAYEMARQLHLAGEGTKMLVLMDSYTPEALKQLESAFLTAQGLENHDQESLLFMDFARDLLGDRMPAPPTGDEQIPNNLKALFNWIFEQAKQKGVLGKAEDMSQIERAYEIFKANVNAMEKYHPEPFNPEPFDKGHITLFRAQDGTKDNGIHDPAKGWADLTGKSFKIKNIPGTHYTILQEPGVRLLADALKDVIV
ncbi:MAG: amino acid adenylation domain-containing protein, partial [Desulfobacteraceae bacterium]|nr:amino acid adenylation domain-containing protein [Desulfobacteraceae bacterium]